MYLAEKLIQIQDLPDCYHKERLLVLANTPSATVHVVGVSESEVDWEAYIGFPALFAMKEEERERHRYGCENIRSFEQVRKEGDKLDEATARSIFFGFSKDFHYRR